MCKAIWYRRSVCVTMSPLEDKTSLPHGAKRSWRVLLYSSAAKTPSKYNLTCSTALTYSVPCYNALESTKKYLRRPSMQSDLL